MGAPRIARRMLVAAVVMATCFAASPAAPQERPAPSAEDRKAAAQRFGEGEKAYKAGDFVHAGEAFEEANRLAPHPSASWNAARAWQRAGENARAANLYAKYLREAPPNDPDRKQSTSALAELSVTLGRIDVVGVGLTELAVDERQVEGTTVYVNPGTHLVRARVRGGLASREVATEAGRVVSVALAAETAPAPTPAPTPTPSPTATTTVAPAPAPAPTASVAPDEPTRKGWHPAVFFVAGGLTLFSAGWTVWAGVETLKQKDKFDEAKKRGASRDELAPLLDEGQKQQGRTNFMIGVTAAGAIFTAITGIWLVGWRDPSAQSAAPARLHAGVGPGSIAIRGSF